MSEEKIAVKVVSVTTLKDESEVTTQMVALQDESERQLKIYIGKCEGKALATGLQGYASDRPGTYDALLAVVSAAGAAVEEVCISDILNETFYALVSVRVGGEVQEVDMRPSDALNVAVRTCCPLFVSEKVFLSLLDAEPAMSQAAEAHSVTVTRSPELIALSAAEVSAELAQMFAEDQSDRTTQPVDWDAVRPRDAARLGRVKQFYHGQALQAGEDYSHAAMILQHSSSAEDHLLAHEFCVAAITQGGEQAKWFTLWLAAASEDRFLMNMGRPQRFGTQYRVSDGIASVYETDPEMEDSLRRIFNVPSLSEAHSHADEMSKEPE
jgi:bifunctional DNase/RNase